MRLDREVRDHRERVVVLDDASRPRPPHPPSRTAIRWSMFVCESPSRPESHGSWTSGAAGSSACSTVSTAGSSSYSTVTAAAAASPHPPSSAAIAATGSPKNFVSPRPAPDDRLMPAIARHRLRQIASGQHARTPGNLQPPRSRSTRSIARACAVQVNELDVQHVRRTGYRRRSAARLSRARRRPRAACDRPIQLSAINTRSEGFAPGPPAPSLAGPPSPLRSGGARRWRA